MEYARVNFNNRLKSPAGFEGPAPIPEPKLLLKYRGASLIRNTPPPRNTIGP